MHAFLYQSYRHVHFAFSAIAILVLAGLASFGTAGSAKADYTCVTNATQIGTTLTFELVSVSGGSYTGCFDIKTIETGSQNFNVSASVTSTQVGATNGGYFAFTRAEPSLGFPLFQALCTQSGQGGVCSDSNSGTMQGVDRVGCYTQGEHVVLPDPALPAIPVTLTTLCTFSY